MPSYYHIITALRMQMSRAWTTSALYGSDRAQLDLEARFPGPSWEHSVKCEK